MGQLSVTGRKLKWSTLLGLLLVACIGVFTVQAAESYIGTTVLVSRNSFAAADDDANHISMTWFVNSFDCGISGSGYDPLCNPEVPYTARIAFASKASNLGLLENDADCYDQAGVRLCHWNIYLSEKNNNRGVSDLVAIQPSLPLYYWRCYFFPRSPEMDVF